MLNFVRGKLCMQITIDDLKAYRSFFTKAIDWKPSHGSREGACVTAWVCDSLCVRVCVWMLMCLQHGGKCVLPLPLGTTPYWKLKKVSFKILNLLLCRYLTEYSECSFFNFKTVQN